jgi:microcystin-dependent protein
MAQPFIGEIRMFAGNFPPVGWAFCEGQSMAISENDALFTLIGTTYGGDGQETFNLPNLASRVPMHMGTGPDGTTYQIGEMAGTEQETLSTQQIPSHNHALMSTSTGQVMSPNGAILADATSTQAGIRIYNTNSAPTTPIWNQTLQPVGGSQPHENTQPFLCINFIISLYGVFPTQN